VDCTVRTVLAAVVVTHSAPPGLLDRCVAAVMHAGGVDHVIVVDNGGHATAPDGAELVRVANDGFGAAANVGFARARALGADTFARVNDDVSVRPGWTDALLAELRREDRIGAVQPKLLFADREPSTVNSLGVEVGADGAGVDLGFEQPDGDFATADIEAFTGGAVVFSDAYLAATGGFDERYFLYYEDIDLAARGRRLGWIHRCVPTSVVDHLGSATTGALPDRTLFLQERNRIWNAFRNEDVRTMAGALWLSIRRLRHEPRATHAKALATGLAGAPRRIWERRPDRR